ncbi:MAG TPA: DNA internalization-related competence protein ComEC/Rec2 [Gammaproteobacteria bacterium]|jgi:competence protein ComEC|nr:DNA internalization-related competence protein ComEC/Rec2 [Gammaproteobacteria bacterium]
MFLLAIGFLLGDIFAQINTTRIPIFYLYLLFAFSILIIFPFRKKYFLLSLLPAFFAGAIFAFIHINNILSVNLPQEVEDKPVTIEGYIANLPAIQLHSQTFFFAMDHYQINNQRHPLLMRIKLSWRTAKHCHVGERWRFTVKINRIHGVKNIGVSDEEVWYLTNGIRAYGYVLRESDSALISKNTHLFIVDQLREHLREKVQACLPHSRTAPWLLALIIGDRSGVDVSDWSVLGNTGTHHLMTIAGLHIGIVASFIYFLVNAIWRRSESLLLLMPVQIASAYAVIVVSFLYVLLAGFSLPSTRAFIMLSVVMLSLIARKQIVAWHAWSVALLIVLVINPLNVLSESFWLSFCTIALIIFATSGRVKLPRFWKSYQIQWTIFLGLLPLSLLFFQEIALLSFIANAIAIPWLEFFILPFCLLAAFFAIILPTFSVWLFYLADKSLAGLWFILTYLSHLDVSVWHHAIASQVAFFLLMIGVIVMLMPAGLPGKWLGIIWAFILFFSPVTQLQANDIRLTLLDVGQGLSVLIETASHVLVYDTGANMGGARDMGERVLVPFLRHQQISRVDMLVISHGDNDHIGGSTALLKAFTVSHILTSVPDKFSPLRADYCLSGKKWAWDGVTFEFIYPNQSQLGLDNDSSCVLRVSNGRWGILLPGDIEKLAENRLLALSPDLLKADILIAPHHGSKTSGVSDFINAVHPRYVLYATGYHNRYHFPHEQIVHAYADIGAVQLDTTTSGSIQFMLSQQSDSPDILLSRNLGGTR